MSRRFWLLAAAIVFVATLASVSIAGKKGQTVHVGEPFGNAKNVEIATLIADPDKYAGKVVRIDGKVASYCHHQRGWFALADSDGAVVRLVTAPAFTVPADIDDVKGVGEGVVEFVDVPEDQAKHYAEDHGLGSEGEKISGPQKQIIVRATGAKFVLPEGAATEQAELVPCDDHAGGHDEGDTDHE